MISMKRILSLLMVFCMICSLAIPAAAAEDVHEHSYEEKILKSATCEKPGVLKKTCTCGDYKYEAIPAGHTKPAEGVETVEAKCGTDGSEKYTCTVCEEKIEVVLPATGKHDFKKDIIVKEATCTTDAEAAEVCSVCSEQNGDAVVVKGTAFGHDMQDEVVTPATCTETGVKNLVCANEGCDEKEEDVVIPAAGHTLSEKDEDIEIIDATCDADAYMKVLCTVCNVKIDVAIDELLPGQEALNHDVEDVEVQTKAATCTEDGYDYQICKNCDEEIVVEGSVVDKLGHTESTESIPATCTTGAYSVTTCSVCEEELDRTEPDDTVGPHGEKVHAEGAPLKSPTCSKPGVAKLVCELCGVAQGYEAIPAAHTAGEPVEENVVAATCTEAGTYDEVIYCSVCEEEMDREVKAIEPAHKYNENLTHVVEEAICGKDGYAWKYCTVCKKDIKVILPATNEHDYQEGATDPECEKNSIAGYVCTVCGKVDPDRASQEVAGTALAHEWTYSNIEQTNCDVPGTADATCSICGEVEEGVEYDTGDHAYEETNVDYVEADCLNDAHISNVCTVCGYVDKIEIAEGDEGYELALGHDLEGVKIEEVTVDCLNNGYKYQICKNCNEEIVVEGSVVEANGAHKSIEVPVAATCTTGAYTITKCEECDVELSRTDAAEEVDPENHGATIEAEVPLKAPTCTKAGVAKLVCELCGERMGYAALAAAHGELSDPIDSEPATCTEDGWEISICSVCDEEVETVIKATGHEEVKVNTVYDCKGGTQEWECANCDAEIPDTTVEADPTKHNWEESYKEATCTEPMYAGNICTICGDGDELAAVGEPNGHDWDDENAEVIKEAECDVAGELKISCKNCDETKTEAITALVHVPGKSEILEADCDNAQREVIKCTVCGEVISSTNTGIEGTEATGHDVQKTTDRAASCSEYALEIWECVNPNCPDYEGQYQEILGDEYDTSVHSVDYKIIKKATCTAAGIRKDYCTNEECDTYTSTYSTYLASHTWGEPVVDEETREFLYKECSVCHTTEVTECVTHKETSEVIVELTCEIDGVIEYTCERCGEVRSETTTAAGHDWENGEYLHNDEVYFTIQCANCEETMTECYGAHTPADAVKENEVAGNCDAKATWDDVVYCAHCKAEISRTAQTAETYSHVSKLITVAAKAATCTEDGNLAYHYCPACNFMSTNKDNVRKKINAVTMDDVTIAAGHTEGTEVAANAATCTAAGNVAYIPCTVCELVKIGENWVEASSATIAATGHTLSATAAQASTCTIQGNSAYWTCTVCYGYFSDANGEIETTLSGVKLPLAEHSLTHYSALEASCEEDGSAETWYCSGCRTHFSDENGETKFEGSVIIPATGHTYANGTCSVCGEADPDAHTHTWTLGICTECNAQCDHSETAQNSGKAATCDGYGYKACTECTICNMASLDGTTWYAKANEIFSLAPTGEHTWENGVCTSGNGGCVCPNEDKHVDGTPCIQCGSQG